MKLPRFRYVALAAALTGLLIPVASLLYIRFVAGIGSLWTVVVWPTSLMLLGPEVAPDAPGFGTLCLSILLDGVWYLIVFAVLWSLCWVFARWRASLRDGTTI